MGGPITGHFLFIALLWLFLALPVGSQTPTPSPEAPSPAASPLASPSPTPNKGTWAELQGLRLIQVHSLPNMSGQDRADLLVNRLEKALREYEDPTRVSIENLDGTIVLSCHGVYLISVTNVDAQALGTDIPGLAARWSKTLEDGINRLGRERSGTFLQDAVLASGVALLVGVLLNYLLRWATIRWFNTPGYSVRILSWLIVVSFILWQYPNTRPLANGLLLYAVRPLGLLGLVVGGAVLTSYILGRILHHYFEQVGRVRERTEQTSPRLRQRVLMIRQVAIFVLNLTLAVLALVVYFGVLDVNLGAVMAGASFVGVGLGLAAQDMLKDWMSGVNIILEDQFGTGDYIQTAGHEGTVENFTLRITQLRDTSGSLTTLPNSSIRAVRNLSNLWSQVDATIPVAYHTDLRKALRLLEETARQLKEDWPDKIVDNPQVLGLEEFGEYAIRLRLLMRTAPLQQWMVRRELMLRLKEVYDAEGIEVPYKQIKVHLSEGEPERPGIVLGEG